MSIAHSSPTRRRVLMRSAAAGAAAVIALAVVGGLALAQQDKYTVTVPGGLAFSEFRGYEDWPVISISDNNGKFAAILGNPVMMQALRAGVPGDGRAFPDGAKMAKIHWTPKTQGTYPGPPKVPGTQFNADVMVKDSKNSHPGSSLWGDGWGWSWFDAGNPMKTTSASYKKDCLSCHVPAQATDWIYTAGYPALK